MRVWERGVGMTLACGTGACATAVAAIRRGLADRKVEVVLDGGTLKLEWREEDGHVLMTGPSATPLPRPGGSGQAMTRRSRHLRLPPQCL